LNGVNELALRNGNWYTTRLVQAEANQKKRISTDGVVIVTGGTSGLGLLYAKWLANNGQKELALVSRSGMKSETQDVIDEMTKANCNVKVYKADITNLTGVNALIGDVEQQQGQISGLVHAAGLLVDSALYNMTTDQLFAVMDAKVSGAWNLHKALEDKSLDLFVCFSSAASILGTTGQGNYVAANYFLDQLAHYRSSLGLVATTINWGNIGEVGMAAAQENRGDRLKEEGMDIYMPSDIPNLLESIHGLGIEQVIALKINMQQWAKNNPNVSTNTFYSHLLSDEDAVEENIGNEVLAADTYNGAIKRLKEILKTHVSTITKISAQRIKEDATFKSMGIDSMMALQLKNKVKAEFDLNLAVSTIWTYPTIEKYAGFVGEELKLKERFASPDMTSTDDVADADTYSTAIKRLRDTVKQTISSVTKIPVGRLKEDTTFKRMGIDSMMALQLKNKLQAELKLKLTVSTVWTYPTIDKYVEFLGKELKLKDKYQAQEVKPTTSNVDDMSLEDVMRELGEK
jgi:NAD(P)-dependent dehydrogenase (short-subunit alcohol dehydrogenase family)/acyl carrier protein